jgi:hypothetical protein
MMISRRVERGRLLDASTDGISSNVLMQSSGLGLTVNGAERPAAKPNLSSGLSSRDMRSTKAITPDHRKLLSLLLPHPSARGRAELIWSPFRGVAVKAGMGH